MDFIDLIEKLETRINSYWNFYIVIVLANAGWVFNNENSISIEIAIGLSVGLILFFISNLRFQQLAIETLSVVREELNKLKENKTYPNIYRKYSEEAIRYRYSGTILLHIIFDIVLIVFIFMNVK